MARVKRVKARAKYPDWYRAPVDREVRGAPGDMDMMGHVMVSDMQLHDAWLLDEMLNRKKDPLPHKMVKGSDGKTLCPLADRTKYVTWRNRQSK
jgi:hypothetical protein